MAEGARQAQPERSRELGVIQVDPDRLPTARTGSPSGVARMIHPPQVRPEEPIAVTPHDGICGGKSQQWLSYPTVGLWRRHTRPARPRPCVLPYGELTLLAALTVLVRRVSVEGILERDEAPEGTGRCDSVPCLRRHRT